MGTGQTPHVLWSVAQMGFAAQATYWSAVDLHKAVMPSICDALHRPLRETHLEATTASDLQGRDARLVYETSPWAADKEVAEVIRPAPVQVADNVARDMAYAKLQSRILAAAEAAQAAKRHHALPPEQQAVVLSAGELGTGTNWTAMHKSRQRCYRTRNGGWPQRCDSARRLMLDHAPRVPCAKATLRAVAGEAPVSLLAAIGQAGEGLCGHVAPCPRAPRCKKK